MAKKKDPHKTLRVKKGASKADVKKAYRALVLEHHPDRGGDRKTFEDIQEAYDELSGKERKPDQGLGKIYANISTLFMGTMAAMVQRGIDPATQDMIGHMKDSLKTTIGNKEQEKRKLKSDMRPLQKALGRFTVKDAENIFESTLRQAIQEGEEKIAKADEEIAFLKECYDFLGKCTYRFDNKTGPIFAMSRPQSVWFTSTGSATGETSW